MKKSILSPTQELEFLGFLLNSLKMTITLPSHKLHSLKKMVRRMLDQERTSVWEVARLLGTMVAAHSAILPAPLYCRRAKTRAVKRGLSYEGIDHDMRSDLLWWFNHSTHHNGCTLQVSQWDMVIESDASRIVWIVWGASCQDRNTGGPWTRAEKSFYIN